MTRILFYRIWGLRELICKSVHIFIRIYIKRKKKVNYRRGILNKFQMIFFSSKDKSAIFTIPALCLATHLVVTLCYYSIH